MIGRKSLAPVLAVLTLVIGSQAVAGKLISTQPFQTALPNITADGKVDLANLGPDATGTLKAFRGPKGSVIFKVEVEGTVTNASGKNFKTKNFADLGIDESDFGPGLVVTQFQYSVSKSGKAVLEGTADLLTAPATDITAP